MHLALRGRLTVLKHPRTAEARNGGDGRELRWRARLGRGWPSLTELRIRATLRPMKRKKGQAEKPSAGTAIGAKYRERCNKLTDAEREKLSDEFLKLYYAGSASQPARRR